MRAIHCADCGSACALVPGAEVDPRDPDIADAHVWACPVCSCAWAALDPVTGTCIGLPAGPETIHARRVLRVQVIEPLVRQAPAPERILAAGRVAGYLAAHLGLPREVGTLAHLDLHQCRQAWRVRRGVTLDEVRLWSTRVRRTVAA